MPNDQKTNLLVGCAAGFSGDRTDAALPVVQALIASGQFEALDIKSRALRLDDYLVGEADSTVTRDKIAAHDAQLAHYAMERLSVLPGIRIIGPKTGAPRSGLVSFAFEGVHAHDIVTFADEDGVALRGGHHCNQPLMRHLGLTSTTRASWCGSVSGPSDITSSASASSSAVCGPVGTQITLTPSARAQAMSRVVSPRAWIK